jgi:LacI family transcriptional regulator
MHRVTIRDIAAAAGVHHSTVSRALKNEWRIPVATRERIQAVAKELGYRPDPMLSALMAYRNDGRAKSFQANLAWVTSYPKRESWRAFERVDYFRGALARAEELGYGLDEFWLKEPGMTSRRATEILRSRNIQGLVFIPQPRSRARLNLDWDKFSAITFGRSLASPRLHTVDNDHYTSMAILMRQLKKLGYRRIGMAIWPHHYEATDRNCAAAYWAFQHVPPQKQIPIFMELTPWKKKPFFRWMQKYRPDVVVSFDNEIYVWIQEMGLRIPEEIGFALIAKHAELLPHLSGIDENNKLVGATAVDVLVRLIQRRETGAPTIPISTLVEGRWIAGDSTRRVNLDSSTVR